MEKTWNARQIVAGRAQGQALISQEPVCFLGGVDVKTGRFTERGHPLEGQNIKDKILIFPIGKGSTGGSYLLYEACLNHVGPAAVINARADPVTVVGCIISEIPMVLVGDGDLFQTIETGDEVRVDATAGQVYLIRKKAAGVTATAGNESIGGA